MTILPKKKSSQSKSNDVELSGESAGGNHGGGGGGGGGGGSGSSHGGGHQVGHAGHGTTVGGVGHSGGSGASVGGGRTSPPSRVGDGGEGIVNGQIAAAMGALGPLPCSSVVSQHKRRHRASPHRNMRKHRDRSSVAGGTSGCDLIGGSPLAVALCPVGPSTSNSVTSADRAGAGCSVSDGPIAVAQGNACNSLDAEEEDFSGYNSGDEYSQSRHMWSEEEWAERERIFEKKMRKKGLVIKKMGEDGACLFRAVADQVYGDQEMHAVVRKHCMDYMAKNADYFSQYVTEDFNGYLTRKRLDHIHGNHVEMQALCEMYNRSIEVYSYAVEPINTFHGIQSTDNESIRISYHKNSHYNSIIDPYKATVGVGLGLPGFMPGLAEKNLMHDAVRQSEEFHIEQTMLEDKLKATDWEATNEAIEEQVARESYLQWLRDNERRARKATHTRSATATCSSSCGGGASPDIRSPTGGRSPRGRPTSSTPPAGNSPSRDTEGASSVNCGVTGPSHVHDVGHHSGGLALGGDGCDNGGNVNVNVSATSSDFRLLETASFMNQLPPHVFGLTEWDDADILAQVLAASQQEYLDSLRRSASSSTPPPSTSQQQQQQQLPSASGASREEMMRAMES